MAVENVTGQNDMLDLIVWRHYGFQQRAVEAGPDANPPLSARPPMLPEGVTITLPEIARPRGTPPKIRLWDVP
ncbi:tail protein X [Dichotomicrobium thermohalophilum]|uniref:Phage tail protein X n=1 Tax=Dichotomicrobium thermohalophilum TaxID=933063 RepID=A0A397PIN3_9HYPH|nr:tail protein X [Dichotomicrobium thermohalophilum]RIA47749.1 phage tail protein X [Dichotomicrobium thermohalophilum]